MAAIPTAVVEHYQRMQRLQVLGLVTARRAWERVNGRFISESWLEQLALLRPVISGVQLQAATAGATYSAATLAAEGTYVAPEAFADPAGFASTAPDGRPLETLLYSPATTTKTALAGGMALEVALTVGLSALETIVRTVLADTGRQAAGVDVTTRPGVGYTRMLNPPSCARCIILAGRFYRWNAGFNRHPRCDCVHVATAARSLDGARREGLIDDPYAAFKSMSRRDQDRTFGKANAEAIRDGADISQVVNARRGMTPNGLFTTEGTSRRGNASRLLAPRQRRMTPELIYAQAGSRDEALDLLRHHGYLLPKGQVPTGALRGQSEGFGALGRGGTRRAASQAVLDARATGVRDPNSRYTMTGAERQLYDARRRYETALQGIDPYTSPGFGNTPDPYGLRLNRVGASTRPATPAVIARAEIEYRQQLAAAGQRFTPPVTGGGTGGRPPLPPRPPLSSGGGDGPEDPHDFAALAGGVVDQQVAVRFGEEFARRAAAAIEHLGYTVVSDGAQAVRGMGTLFLGEIRTSTDRSVGELTRELKIVDGHLTVENAMFTLGGNHQGKGIATALAPALESWYRANGVARIIVHANIDVGGYTWAAQGFDWADRMSAGPIDDLLERIAAEAEADDDIDSLEQIESYRSRLDGPRSDWPTPRMLAMIGRRPGMGRDDDWPGKRGLAQDGVHWHGVKHLNP